MSIFEDRPVRTIEESARRHREVARRGSLRRTYIYTRALRWLKRHNPEVLAKIKAEARRKVPTLSGRKNHLRAAA